MHIVVNRDVLLTAFSHSQSVIEKRTTLLILGHTLIEAQEGTATVSSTDMVLSMSESLPCEVLEAGSLCVPTILLYEILRKIKSNIPVDLSCSPQSAQIILSAGRSRFEIPYIASSEFPRVLQEQNEFLCNFSIPAPLLKNMLETVRFAMSTDEMRYSLVGINLSYEPTKNVIRAVATDRHRLACVEIPAPQGTENLPSIIIGKKVIGEMVKLLDEAAEPVSLSVSETRIELKVTGSNSVVVLGSRLIDGSFPDFEAILRIEHERKLVAGTQVFADAVDRVGTVINDKLRMIRITLSRNLMKCSAIAGASSNGAADEDVDISYDYDDTTEFNFDVRYLLDIAQHISTDELEVSISSPDVAIAIRPVGLSGVFFALMSMAPAHAEN
ncbi:MAG: DNA polymerase III subunit beta [Holosporales bacterium]|jgi:DNA polymerase-3 subunit beta|nr:DNA polymerase III subunit beta [Holosporales bacterium]